MIARWGEENESSIDARRGARKPKSGGDLQRSARSAAPRRLRYHASVSLLRTDASARVNADALRTTLAEREAALVARAADVARTRAEVREFSVRYRQQVGQLHDELDALQRALAEAELLEINKRLDAEPGQATAAGPPPLETPARFTSDAIRKLFRDVAKTIHPDLADDETRDRRHALMVEANLAYASSDEERLRSILDAWARSPEAVSGTDPEAIRERLERRIAQIDEELAACEAALTTLRESPMWQLKVMVDEASAHGKDLIGDMVRRLERDILVERNRLDAMRWGL